MMGHYYQTKEGEKMQFLGAVDFHTVGGDVRMIGNYAFHLTDSAGGSDVVGFENHSGRLDTDKAIITEDNFIMTYILGPILVRNPQLNDMIIKRILEKHPDEAEKYSPNHKLEQKAYDVFKSSMK